MGIDTKPLEQDKQEAIAKLRQLTSDVANINLESGGEKSGHSMGRGFEHGLKGKFREIQHAAHLFAGILGGFLGQQFEEKFAGTAKEGIAGALGGLAIGSMFGPIGAAVGIAAGAITGILTKAIFHSAEEMKKLTEIAEKFHIPVGDVKELQEATKDFAGEDGLSKMLERWNKLLDGIIEKKPEVIDALKKLGIEGNEALQKFLSQSPASADKELAQKIVSTFAPSQFGELTAEKQKQFEEANQEAIHSAQIGATAGGQTVPLMPSEKRLDITADEVNKIIAAMPQGQGKKFVEEINTVAGGLDNFVKVFNNARKQTEGKPLSTFEQLTIANKMDKKSGEDVEKQHKATDKALEDLHKTQLESLAIAEQIAERTKEQSFIEHNLNAMVGDNRINADTRLIELKKQIAELTHKQIELTEKEAEKELKVADYVEKRAGLEQQLGQAKEQEQDRGKFSLSDLANIKLSQRDNYKSPGNETLRVFSQAGRQNVMEARQADGVSAHQN